MRNQHRHDSGYSKPSGFRHADPRKWLPLQSAIASLAEQLQIEYLQTAGNHATILPNFIGSNCLREKKSGEIVYDFGEEAHFESLADLPSVPIKKKKRSSEDTPQGGARRKR